MLTVIGLYLVSLAIGLFIWMGRQHNRGQVQLLSVRNVFLVGFVHFQLMSVATWIWYPHHEHWPVQDPDSAVLKFALMATIFLGVCLGAYRGGRMVRRLARRLPSPKVSPSDTFLVVLAVALTVAALALRFALRIPIVAIVAVYLGAGFAAVASGLAAWVWVTRMGNPVAWAFTAGIVGINMLSLMTTIGRRALVSIAIAVLWGVYYKKWHRFRATSLTARLGLLGIGPLILIAMFTSIRGARGRPVSEVLNDLKSASPVSGVTAMIRPQDTGTISLWIIENYPEKYDYRHLFSLKFFFEHFVPRAWWPEKPVGLSVLAPYQVRHPARGKISVGPGIIGHAEAEGGWYALVIYALLSGLSLRLCDEAIVAHYNNIFVVLPIGTALGQIMAVPRGETGLMAGISALTIVGTGLAMLLLGQLIASISPPSFSAVRMKSETKTR